MVILDFDGVAYETQSIMLNIFNKRYNRNYKLSDLKYYDLGKDFDNADLGNILYILGHEVYSARRKIRKDVSEAIHDISEVMSVRICTLCYDEDVAFDKVKLINSTVGRFINGIDCVIERFNETPYKDLEDSNVRFWYGGRCCNKYKVCGYDLASNFIVDDSVEMLLPLNYAHIATITKPWNEDIYSERLVRFKKFTDMRDYIVGGRLMEHEGMYPRP